MLNRNDFIDRHCVYDVEQIVQQVPLRAEARLLLEIDNDTAGLLLLWSLIRWERNFPIRTLEAMGIDLWALTRDVDEQLRSRCTEAPRSSILAARSRDCDSLLRFWLDRAAMEARALHRDYVGAEHLLLALLHKTDSPAATVLRSRGVEAEAFATAIETALKEVEHPFIPITRLPRRKWGVSTTSWIVAIDSPAVGVPRRFGVFVMLMIVTLYAVLFSLLRTLNFSPLSFALVGGFVAIVGLGQAVLYGGRYPRAASVWVGVFLFPCELFVSMYSERFQDWTLAGIIFAIIYAVFLGIPLGAIVGYLVGTLTAGGFYLLDRLEKRRLAVEKEAADK